MIGVDLRNADVEVDLGTADGRQEAIGRISELSDGALDGLVTCAGLAGLPDRPASLLISVNYFGTVELLAGLREVLAAGTEPAAVAISSNATTTQPGIPLAIVEACLEGDEAGGAGAGGRRGVAQHLRGHQARAGALDPPSRTHGGVGRGEHPAQHGSRPAPRRRRCCRRGSTTRSSGRSSKGSRCRSAAAGKPEEIAALVEFLLGPDAAVLLRVGGVLRRRHRRDDARRRHPARAWNPT